MVVDGDRRLIGVITQTDLIAVLYRAHVVEAVVQQFDREMTPVPPLQSLVRPQSMTLTRTTRFSPHRPQRP
jgi:predicted transcriptional regulator